MRRHQRAESVSDVSKTVSTEGLNHASDSPTGSEISDSSDSPVSRSSRSVSDASVVRIKKVPLESTPEVSCPCSGHSGLLLSKGSSVEDEAVAHAAVKGIDEKEDTTDPRPVLIYYQTEARGFLSPGEARGVSGTS